MLAASRRTLESFLQSVLIVLMVSLTLVVVVAVVYRKMGASLAWYDEIASIMLAWVTYYGAALAALKRGHIGFDGLVRSFSLPLRKLCVVIAEVLVLCFFALLAWMGFVVLDVLEGDTLVSLPEVSVQITQSVIPIGALLFILCEIISIPEHWRDICSSRENEPGDERNGDQGDEAR